MIIRAHDLHPQVEFDLLSLVDAQACLFLSVFTTSLNISKMIYILKIMHC